MNHSEVIPGRRKGPAGATVVLMVVTALTGACGTRVSRDSGEAGAGAPQVLGGLAHAVADADSQGSPVTGSATPSTIAPGAVASSAIESRAVGGQRNTASATRGLATNVPVPGAAAPNISTPRAPEPSASSPGPAVPIAPTPGGTGPKSPALVASVGHYSGPAGAAAIPLLQGAQTWVRWVNDRGGVNGHPVQLIVYDDGTDPARHKSQVREAVEQRHVIAFVPMVSPFAGPVDVEYLTAKRVPVIGSEGGGDWFYQSPVYFPQSSSSQGLFDMAVYGAAEQLVPAGKTKVATLVCVETEICRTIEKTWTDLAPDEGLEVVYRGNVSLGQPDFTAECLSARNAGAQVLFFVVDGNSQRRIAASCNRQGYRPVLSTPSTLVIDAIKDDPNVSEMVATSSVFPYFQSGTPATDEFHQAMKTYGSKVSPGVGPAVGWVAAKVFERAAANLSEPPTSEDLLKGLWTVKADTLGGLTGPLTFTENQPATRTVCWHNIAIKNHAWVSPDGYKLQCRPPRRM